MELSGFGHPIVDLAITRARMLLINDRGLAREEARDLERRAMREVWESLLATYLNAADAVVPLDPDRMTAVLAEVERCCFNYGVGRLAGTLNNWQRQRVDLCAERLRALLR